MTQLDVMKQALEALEEANPSLSPNGRADRLVNNSITNLRTAITEMENAEPVGFVTDSGYGAVLCSNHGLDDGTPLYAQPTIKDYLTVQTPIMWTLNWPEEGGIQDWVFATKQEAGVFRKQYSPDDQAHISVEPLFTHPAQSRDSIIEECITAYSPDDSAQDWMDKLRALKGK